MSTRKLFTVLLLAGLLAASLAPIAGTSTSSAGALVSFIPLVINPRAEGIQQDAVIWLPLAIPKSWGGCYNFRIVTQAGQEVPYYAFRCMDGDQGAMIPPYMSLAEYRVARDLARSFQTCTLNNRPMFNIRSDMLGSLRTYYVGSILHYLILGLSSGSFPTTLVQGRANEHNIPPAYGWLAYQINITSYFLVPFANLVTTATLHLDFYPFRPILWPVTGGVVRVEGAAINCQSIVFTAEDNVRYLGRFNNRTIPLESTTVAPTALLSRSFPVQLVPGINILNLNFTASYMNPYLRLVVPNYFVALVLLRIPQAIPAGQQLQLYVTYGSTNPFNRNTFSVFVQDFEQRTFDGLRIIEWYSSVSYPVHEGRVWFDVIGGARNTLEISSTPVMWGRAMWTLIRYEQWMDVTIMNSAATAFRSFIESYGVYGPTPPLPFYMLQWAMSWSDRTRWVGALWFWNVPHHYHAVAYEHPDLPRPDYNTWHGIYVNGYDTFQPIDFIGVSPSPPKDPRGWNVVALAPQVVRVQVIQMPSSSSPGSHNLYAQISLHNQILWGGDSITRSIKIRTGLIDFLNVSAGISAHTFNSPRSVFTLQLTRPPTNTTVLFLVGNNILANLTVLSNAVRWREGNTTIEIAASGQISAVHMVLTGTVRRLSILYASGAIDSREVQARVLAVESMYFITPSPLVAAIMEHQYFQIHQPGLLQIHMSYVDYLGRRGTVVVTDAVNTMMPNNADIDLQEDHVTVAMGFVYPLRANITLYIEPFELPFLILIPQIESSPSPLTVRATAGERFIFSSLNQSLRMLPVPDYIKPLVASGVILASLLTMPVLPPTVSASLATIFAMFFIWTGWIPLPAGVSSAAILSLLAALLILVLVSHRLRGKT